MKVAVPVFASLAIVCLLVVGAYAAEETLKGTVTCAKCDLKEKEFVDKKACQTVVVVKKDSKDVVYYFDPEGHKKHHGPVCTTPKKGSVTGTVADKDGKKWITKVTKVELEK